MRNLTVGIFLFLFGQWAISQNMISNSPYSSFGLGELGGLDHAVLSGIGNTTITMQDSTFINFYNPSSYSSLAKGLPLFSVGVSSRLSTYSENGREEFNSLTSIQHFALAFPFAKRFGLAFGLKPYSRRGYEFSSRTAVEGDSLYYNYAGTGGINEGFVGFSATILDFRGAKLALGGNFGYLFGNVSNIRKSGLIQSGASDYAGGINIKKISVGSFHYELGIHYAQRINDKHSFSVSAVIDPFQKIKGSYEDGLYFSNTINNPNNYNDTISYYDAEDGYITNVPTYTYGLSYTFRGKARKGQTNQLNTEVSVHASYSTSDWTKYEDRFDPSFTNSFLASSKWTAGVQYVPETEFIVNKVSTKFYHRLRYRIGAYYQSLPYQTNGDQVTDFGTTFGLGIPVAVQNSLSSINFGFTYGNRGVADKQSLNEQYYGINVGICIAPGTDRWFVKRKLN